MKFYFHLLIFLCTPYVLHGGRQKTASTMGNRKKKIFVKSGEKKKQVCEFFEIFLQEKKIRSISLENSPSHALNDHDKKKESHIQNIVSGILRKKTYHEDFKKKFFKENTDTLMKDFQNLHLKEDPKVYLHGCRGKSFDDLDNDSMEGHIDSNSSMDNFPENHSPLNCSMNDLKNPLDESNHRDSYDFAGNSNTPVSEEMDYREFSFFPLQKSNIQQQ